MENTDKSSKELHSEPLHKAGVIGSRFKPILFSAPMVQAILDGRKTQTRRIVKPQPTYLPITTTLENHESILKDYLNSGINKNIFKSQKIKIGDILWVRETWQQECELIQIAGGDWSNAYLNATGNYVYKSDNIILPSETETFSKWKPSIFMPKEACRIFLKVTNVRVERLNDISEGDAISEGIISKNEKLFFDYENKTFHYLSPQNSFKSLWNSINKNWEENPFVWVYTFERIERPHDFR